MLSARNQFQGIVKSLKVGEIVAEVVVAVGDLEVVSVITRTSVEHLGLKVGEEVTAVIKSTETCCSPRVELERGQPWRCIGLSASSQRISNITVSPAEPALPRLTRC